MSKGGAAGASARVSRRGVAERPWRGPRLRARVRDPLRRRRLFREAPEPVVRGADDQADQSPERDVAALVVAHRWAAPATNGAHALCFIISLIVVDVVWPKP